MPEGLRNYFEPYEFACKCGCGARDIEAELLEKLNFARYYYGHSMSVNSGARCEKHNASKKVGGSSTSSHITKPMVKCKATDLKCIGSRERHLMLDALFWAGFKRIGVNSEKGFIHVDVDKSKDQDVFWIYPPKKKKILNILRRKK